MSSERVNDNISLVCPASQRKVLADNEYFAVMVIDHAVGDKNGQLEHGDERKFFRKELGWLGLERTSGEQIYISKSHDSRYSPERGETWIVSVRDPSKCCVLKEWL